MKGKYKTVGERLWWQRVIGGGVSEKSLLLNDEEEILSIDTEKIIEKGGMVEIMKNHVY